MRPAVDWGRGIRRVLWFETWFERTAVAVCCELWVSAQRAAGELGVRLLGGMTGGTRTSRGVGGLTDIICG